MPEENLHFIGIGGIGMSALARYYHLQGKNISGSDKECSNLIKDLQNEGIKNIWCPHNKEKIQNINPGAVVYSTAITKDNEELIWAKENKKTILHRSELLELTTKTKKLISVSGTHGKTTTSAMILEMLKENNFNPSGITGGIMVSNKSNIVVGGGEYFLIEADESDRSFLKGNIEIAIITNIEPDHLENYNGNFEEIKNSFLQFAKKSLLNKGLIYCIEDKYTRKLIQNNFNINDTKLVSYGFWNKSIQPVFSAKFLEKSNLWEIYHRDNLLHTLKLKIPGEHNILNALAAYGTGFLIGLSPEKIKYSLENYRGVKRRFEFLGKIKGATIIDDYAHHPTEIKATIKAAKELNPKRLISILQPHQPTRLKDLWDEFVKVLRETENPVYITDIYVARGNHIEGITAKQLVRDINKPNIQYLSGNIEEITNRIEKLIESDDLILIMGAGDITNVGQRLLNANKVGAGTNNVS